MRCGVYDGVWVSKRNAPRKRPDTSISAIHCSVKLGEQVSLRDRRIRALVIGSRVVHTTMQQHSRLPCLTRRLGESRSVKMEW